MTLEEKELTDEIYDLRKRIRQYDQWIAAIYPILRHAEKYPVADWSDDDEIAFRNILKISLIGRAGTNSGAAS